MHLSQVANKRFAYSGAKGFNDASLKDVSKRDPVKETKEGVEGSLDQAGLVGLLQDFTAKLENLRELSAH